MSSLAQEQVQGGYQKTEVGVIPEDWDIKPIGEFADVSSGGTPNRENKKYWNGNIPWVTTTLINGKEINAAEQFITEEGITGSATKWYSAGTLLMAMYGQGKTRGKVSILGIDATINQACAGIVVNRLLDNQFLLHYLIGKYNDIRNLSNSGGQENLSGEIIKHICVPVPKKEEQTAIANALSDVDALIASLEKLISKKRAIKTAAMQQLLTGKKRLPPFDQIHTSYKQTELGEIPEDWEVSRLGDMGFDISDGNYSSKYPRSDEFRQTGVPFIRANNMKNLTVVDDDMRFISEKKHSDITKGHLKKGDVLITNRGEIGNLAIVPDAHVGSNINAQIVRINTKNSSVENTYFAYYLQKDEVQQKFRDLQTGSALKQLPVNRLLTLLVFYPSEAEQLEIANFMSAIDSEIFSLEQRLTKTQQLKQGMMQELLTGRTRLV